MIASLVPDDGCLLECPQRLGKVTNVDPGGVLWWSMCLVEVENESHFGAVLSTIHPAGCDKTRRMDVSFLGEAVKSAVIHVGLV